MCQVEQELVDGKHNARHLHQKAQLAGAMSRPAFEPANDLTTSVRPDSSRNMKFRQRVEAVVEKFNDMHEDLGTRRKFMGRQWAKRETQIVSVIESTVGLVGDLQAIAGKAMPEIPSLDIPLLERIAS